MSSEAIWLTIGLAAQGCFSLRFVWQWIVSERAGSSQIPLAFWYFSLLGGSLLFVYAVHRIDPVFMLGQGVGVLIYIRNLFLIYKARRAAPAQAAPLPPTHLPHRHLVDRAGRTGTWV